tara:strand:+ start:156 stop:437 length:282 start_codon:yes stop_codon:yes gene_type:complete
MICNAENKIKGGKLIRIKCEIKEDILNKIKFSGDFFLHPEEKLNELEELLQGMKINEINTNIINFFRKNNVILLGIKEDDFANIFESAIKELK